MAGTTHTQDLDEEEDPFSISQKDVKQMNADEYIQLLDRRLQYCNSAIDDIGREMRTRGHHMACAGSRRRKMNNEGVSPRNLAFTLAQERIKHQRDALRSLQRQMKVYRTRREELEAERNEFVGGLADAPDDGELD